MEVLGKVLLSAVLVFAPICSAALAEDEISSRETPAAVTTVSAFSGEGAERALDAASMISLGSGLLLLGSLLRRKLGTSTR